MFILELGQKGRQLGRRKLQLLHHSTDLADHDGTVDVGLYLAQGLEESLLGILIEDKVAEAPIITIKQDGCWLDFAIHGRNLGLFFFLEIDIFNFLNEVTILVIQTNVEGLRSANILSILARPLDDFVVGDLAINHFVLVVNAVAALGLDPVLRPLVQVVLLLSRRLIDSILNSTDEIRQGGVAPRVTLEIDLKAIGESLPPNQEDQLLNHGTTLSISDSINERLGSVSARTVSLNLVV